MLDEVVGLVNHFFLFQTTFNYIIQDVLMFQVIGYINHWSLIKISTTIKTKDNLKRKRSCSKGVIWFENCKRECN
jgi:hypothetical protein